MPAEPVDPVIIYGYIGRCPACGHPIRFGRRRDPSEIPPGVTSIGLRLRSPREKPQPHRGRVA